VEELGLGELALLQRGVAHRCQLLRLGISAKAIAHRMRKGELHLVLPSVLAVGHAALPELGAEVAALLHAGDGAVLSHRTAAALWGFATRGSELQVTLRRHVRDLPTFRAHRVAVLDLRDVRLHHGLPVTAPARAMLDLAGEATPDELIGALAEARVRKLVTDAQLQAAMGRAPYRTGVAQLRAVMGSAAGSQPTRSRGERRILALIAQAGLPAPQANAPVCGFEADLLWRSERVIVEYDGWETHGHRRAFARDRRRDQILGAAGYHVIRVTWWELTHEPTALIVRIAQTLARAAG
jgi:uncharacterized protein DUF559